jgi:hypothetical protein
MVLTLIQEAVDEAKSEGRIQSEERSQATENRPATLNDLTAEDAEITEEEKREMNKFVIK